MIFQTVLNACPQAAYPIPKSSSSALSQRIDQVAALKVKTPKSEVLIQAEDEKYEADRLLEIFRSKASSYGIRFSEDGKLMVPKLITPERLAAELSQGIDQRYYRLLNDPFWIDYDNYYQQNLPAVHKQLSALYSKLTQISNDLLRELKIVAKGEHGEEAVQDYLRLYEGKFLIRHNVLLDSRTSHRAQTAETDTCLITPKGVFVCEIKNIGNEDLTLKVTNDGRWSKVYASGKTDYFKESPSAQNEFHCREMECFLQEAGFGHVPVFPVVIIANDRVKIKNESVAAIVRKDFIGEYYRSLQAAESLNHQQMQAIADALDRVEVSERYFDVLTISSQSIEICSLTDQLLQMYQTERGWLSALNACVTPHLQDLVQKLKLEEAAAAEKQAHAFRPIRVTQAVLKYSVLPLFVLFFVSRGMCAILSSWFLLVTLWLLFHHRHHYARGDEYLASPLRKLFLPGVLVCLPLSLFVAGLLGYSAPLWALSSLPLLLMVSPPKWARSFWNLEYKIRKFFHPDE